MTPKLTHPHLETLLRRALDADVKAGRIAASRSNRIERSHYAKKLDTPRSRLLALDWVFKEYEERLGVCTGPMRHLPEMRAWLEANYAQGTLQLHNDKADRKTLFNAFGFKGGTVVTRHPEIRQLLAEFDERINKDDYLPSAQKEQFERFTKALNDPRAIGRDRISISPRRLSQLADVPLKRLVGIRFAAAISARNMELEQIAATSKIDPFFHGRVFAFSELVGIWPHAFLKRISVRFKQVISARSQQSSKGPYLQLLRLLKWIASSPYESCKLVISEAAELGTVRTASHWEDAVYSYRTHLVNQISENSATITKVDTEITYLRAGLEALVSGRLVPELSVLIPGIKHARRFTVHRMSVAEASPTQQVTQVNDYIEFARQRFAEACKFTGFYLNASDQTCFFDGLAQEIPGTSFTTPGNPAAAVRAVLKRRLESLRMKALEQVYQATRAHEVGKALLSEATIDAKEFHSTYFGRILTRTQRNSYLREHFPAASAAEPTPNRRAIANLLCLIEECHNGIPPSAWSLPGAPFGQFYQKRYLELGGVGAIDSMLHPSADCVGAVLTLYLIESGANVSVGRTLDHHCMEPSDLDAHVRITGHKARADGKPIVVDLPSDSSAVMAMEWLLTAGSRLRKNCKGDGDRLFLMRMGSGVQLMTPHWFTSYFKALARSAPGLEHASLVPSMIRPSVLLEAALSEDGRLALGQAIGQHGLAVSQGYQQKWPTRLLYDANISRFLKAFETLVVSNIEGAASKLGISPKAFEARLASLRATGLGTFCRDSRGRPGSQSNACTTVDCWNDCPNLLIVAEVEAIATMQIWQNSLRDVRPEWERDRPERWDQVWLPWLCLVDVVEEKMSRGSLLTTWNAAKRRASEMSATTGFLPPRPY